MSDIPMVGAPDNDSDDHNSAMTKLVGAQAQAMAHNDDQFNYVGDPDPSQADMGEPTPQDDTTSST
jgi:hypothetical protein